MSVNKQKRPAWMDHVGYRVADLDRDFDRLFPNTDGGLAEANALYDGMKAESRNVRLYRHHTAVDLESDEENPELLRYFDPHSGEDGDGTGRLPPH